ncbi:hypothetical protein ACDZ29_27900 (plasmid) [Peribacillus sp. RS7]|uniref:hypothetical protein n=1 Tax=Peribacillus sp. RS7 TaxID=3242679 RepID=UPI0035C1B739
MGKDKKCKDCGHSKCKCKHKKCKDCGKSKCKCESKQEQQVDQNVEVIVNVPAGPQGAQGPQGVQGPQGDQGPTALKAFGSLRGDAFLHPVTLGTNIIFSSPGPALNTIPDPTTDTITIDNTGVYEISASLEVLLDPGNGAVFSLVNNGIFFGPEFSAFISSAPGTFSILRTGITVQFTLNVGDMISIQATQLNNNAAYSNASLTVIQIQ